MRASLGTALLLLLFSANPSLQAENLLQADWPGVLGKASEEGRYVYVAFLGEGWSVSCKKFSKRILESQAFRTLMDERLVYCPVHAKNDRELTKEEAARLQSLVIYFDIKSYPTILLIAPDGREILRHGYRDDRVTDYVQLIEAILPPEPSNADIS